MSNLIIDPINFPLSHETTTNTSALHLDGSGDYLNVADDDTLSFADATDGNDVNLPFSMGLWIKKDTATASDCILCKGSNSGSTLEYRIFQGQSRIYMDLCDGNASSGNDYQRIYWNNATTAWQHVVITHDGDQSGIGGGGTKLYINGSAVSMASSGGADDDGMENMGGVLRIGQMQSSSTYTHAGEMCQLILWKQYALSQAEVTYLYAGGAAHRNPLIPAPTYSGHNKVTLWMPLQGDLDDASGNSNDGTAVGNAALSSSTVPF